MQVCRTIIVSNHGMRNRRNISAPSFSIAQSYSWRSRGWCIIKLSSNDQAPPTYKEVRFPVLHDWIGPQRSVSTEPEARSGRLVASRFIIIMIWKHQSNCGPLTNPAWRTTWFQVNADIPMLLDGEAVLVASSEGYLQNGRPILGTVDKVGSNNQ